jgi:hypothetical protein
MKINIGKESFTIEADLTNIENILTKTLPGKIKSYLQARKDIKRIQLSIKNLHNECFNLPPRYNYKIYILSVPRTSEQLNQDSEYRKYVDEKTFDDYSQKRLDEDHIEFDMLQRFYNENGGEDNFVCFYQKGIKLDRYSLQPFKRVYTYSKKDKAVFIIECFRKSDNSYCLFGYCTKNFRPKKL